MPPDAFAAEFLAIFCWQAIDSIGRVTELLLQELIEVSEIKATRIAAVAERLLDEVMGGDERKSPCLERCFEVQFYYHLILV